jgi:HAD superfamily hydrolase (TIGR01509 family)
MVLTSLKALIFDVDGTLAETEEAHRTAFNLAFADAGRDWHWDFETYRALLRITGGKERIAHFLAQHDPALAGDAALIARLHLAKNEHYAALVRSGSVALRDGVAPLIAAGQAQGLKIAIATTTSRSNIDALIAATPLASTDFAAIVTGEDVAHKKPHPEAYHLVLRQLGAHPDACLAFEDSANGLRAALAAGIATIVTPALYTEGEDFTGALHVTPLEQFRLSHVSG